MTIKAYADASHTGAIYEIAVPAGTTFYYIKSDNLGWRENLIFPVGTTSIKFFIDKTFPGEIWSDAEIQRGDLISCATYEGPVSSFEVPATGGTGEPGGDGGAFTPVNSPLFRGDPKAPTPDIANNDTSVATTAAVKVPIAAIPRPPATRYLHDKDKLRQWTRTVDEERRNFLAAGLVGGGVAVATGTLVAGAAHAQQSPLPASGRGATGAPDGYLNVKDFGPVGTSDDTATIRAAAAAAKATFNGWSSKGLYFGPGVKYTVKQPIDFRGISNIQCESWLVWAGGDTGASMRFGVTSKTGSGRYIFHGIYDFNKYAARRYSTVQFSGLQGGHVEIGECNGYVEVYAEPGDYNNVFNSRFFLGRTFRLELHSQGGNAGPFGAGQGWINTNQFYGGALAQLRIGGVWHDCLTAPQGGNTLVTTAEPHLYTTGSLVELYNGTPTPGRHGLVTVLNATQFTIPSFYTGSGWRCMGRGGYPHNDNSFNNTDIEDDPAMVFIQGQCNRITGCRMEAKGELVFGPEAFLNTVEVSNTTHGRMPSAGEVGDMTLRDYSNGKNFYGWVRLPRPWGQ